MRVKAFLFLGTLLFFIPMNAYTKAANLVKITSINNSILVDLFLADEANFLQEVLYPKNADAYVHPDIACQLDAIQKSLQKKDLGLKIKDAYRPLSVQKRLWEIVLQMDLPNPGNYVSDPKVEGGRHPRGVAVDVTLVSLKDFKELKMPPMGFIPQAHHEYIRDLSQEQINNREMLKEVMEEYGFVSISCEWWHYNLSNWRDYEAFDVSFEELENLNV